MSNQNQKSTHEDKLTSQGIHLDEAGIDVSVATWDESLSKVWVDETTGELCASVDRLLFETPLSIAVRFIEPQGFNLNLENLLACLDSMKIGVFAKTVGAKKPDSKLVAKRIAPALYARLPERSAKGPLLSRFYEEVSKYEGELSRLQQYEAQSRRAVQEAVKDDSGRNAIIQLQKDNENLRTEIERLSRKVNQLQSAIESVPLGTAEGALPAGVRVCTVRHVNSSDNVVHLKSDQGQYTFPLSKMQGIPAVNARCLSLHEGGIVRSVWVVDNQVKGFDFDVAQVLNVEGSRLKVRRSDRSELILQSEFGGARVTIGGFVILKMADQLAVEVLPLGGVDSSSVIDRIFEEQLVHQLTGESKLSKLVSRPNRKREPQL